MCDKVCFKMFLTKISGSKKVNYLLDQSELINSLRFGSNFFDSDCILVKSIWFRVKGSCVTTFLLLLRQDIYGSCGRG